MFSIVVYVPESARDTVKAAMFAAGAGRIGLYDSCAWEVLGTGQFRPLPGSDPHIGSAGKVEQVSEWRVEMVCEPHLIRDVIRAMKAAHPYETPAFLVWQNHELSKS